MCFLIIKHTEKIFKISAYNKNVCLNTGCFEKVCSTAHKGKRAFISSDHTSWFVPVSQVVYTFVLIIVPFTFVTGENADMYFGYELCSGNASTAVKKYQWQF